MLSPMHLNLTHKGRLRPSVRARHGRDPQPLAGLVAGFFGGLAGTWAMATFEAVWSGLRVRTAGDPQTRRENALRLKRAGVGAGHSAQGEPRSHHEPGPTPGELAADALYRRLAGRAATPAEQRRVGTILHYGFGAATGAVYGATAEVAPAVTRGAGLPYGTFVWLTADELAMPATGFADPPQHSRPSDHAFVWAGHLAYGLTTELVRRALRG